MPSVYVFILLFFPELLIVSLPFFQSSVIHLLSAGDSCVEIHIFLLQVCRLLACVFLLSKLNSSIQLPLWFQKSTLSVDGWVAYFHQISIGSLSCHDLASLQVLLREMVRKVGTISS